MCAEDTVVDRSLSAGQSALTLRGPTLDAPPRELRLAYTKRERLQWILTAIALGVVIAGFWDYKVVDGFGHDLVAANLIGNTSRLASSFAVRGTGFGVIFAVVAGLAATFTACNCVVYAMLPGLTCSTDKRASRRKALRGLVVFASGVVGVGVLYGLYVGALGAEGAKAFNQARLPQAQLTFTTLGLVLLAWGCLSFGFLEGVVAFLPRKVRDFFARSSCQAGVMGIIVGLFAIGRPYPVFRDFLMYAATAHSPLYGALVMGIQGLGQIALMVALFCVLVFLLGSHSRNWGARKPYQQQLVSAMALVGGGTYFVFYWGLALTLGIGSWGFALGIYR